MSDKQEPQADGRRQRKDRRTQQSPAYTGKERRAIATLREADVFEIYVPPLKGAKERRSTATRRAKPR